MDIFLTGFIIIIVYVILLFILKMTGIGSKKSYENCNNSCPNCQSALHRIQRKTSDHLLHHLTFKIFDARRYFCNNCEWEGLRWEEKFRQK